MVNVGVTCNMGLSWNQNRFLATRLHSRTDREAYEACGLADQTITSWKGQPEFRAAYDHLGEDGLELAKEIARQHLAHALVTLIEGTSAKRTTRSGVEEPDWDARINAAKQILAVHRIGTSADTEVTGKLVVEILRGSSNAASTDHDTGAA